MSYGLTVNLLQEVLPIDNTINAATVRNKVHDVGRRIDEQLGEERVFFLVSYHYATDGNASNGKRIGTTWF